MSLSISRLIQQQRRELGLVIMKKGILTFCNLSTNIRHSLGNYLISVTLLTLVKYLLFLLFQTSTLMQLRTPLSKELHKQLITPISLSRFAVRARNQQLMGIYLCLTSRSAHGEYTRLTSLATSTGPHSLLWASTSGETQVAVRFLHR